MRKACWNSGALVIIVMAPFTAVSVDDVPEHKNPPHHLPEVIGKHRLQAGDSSLAKWVLPALPESDANHDALVNLGRKLFFDKRLSANNNRSCATCHRQELGWSDGLETAMGLRGEPLSRSTPALFNLAYGVTFTWDGRSASLEDQAMEPVFNPDEMGGEPAEIFKMLRGDAFYSRSFSQLFPGQEAIDESAVASALAAFERTLVVRNTPFDQWIAGDSEALTSSEIRGFGVFLDPDRGNCGTCHAPPNFTDDGFHNIGLMSFANEDPDLGRYKVRPVKLMRGAFKTPALRNIGLTAPYFHDGSVQTLEEVVEHYADGGRVKDNLSPEMKAIELDAQEKRDLVAFLEALTEVSTDVQSDSIELASD